MSNKPFGSNESSKEVLNAAINNNFVGFFNSSRETRLKLIEHVAEEKGISLNQQELAQAKNEIYELDFGLNLPFIEYEKLNESERIGVSEWDIYALYSPRQISSLIAKGEITKEQIWTVADGDNCIGIYQGQGVVNRIGYLLTKETINCTIIFVEDYNDELDKD